MKIIFLFLCLSVSAFTKTHAQLVVRSASEASAKTTTGKAISDLAHALKNDTYIKTAAKAKAALLTKSFTLTTPSEAGAALVSLSQMIKPAKFKSSFKAGIFGKTAASISTIKQANALLMNLESAMTPDAFNPIWKMQRASWLSTIK